MNRHPGKLSIGIYGGAFDPPHSGHVHAIITAASSGLFDEIWIVPTRIRDDKSYHVSDDSRLMLLKALVENEMPDVAIPVQIKLFEHENKINGTVELFDFLRSTYNDYEFLFICGDELLKDLPGWRNAERLKDIPFIIVARETGSSNKKLNGYDITFLKNDKRIAISSTEIRERIKRGGDLDKVIPSSVMELIRKYSLYS